ncbi:MAG: hypothetical protein HY221_01015 [Candidatus Sungbacteria bacterium]|uniref:Uncharacterized protein n=1 Tax=Candidatus Sungiibacteriota bacterium TaxID=2750080 RepID=A0A932QY27_9BACT|nr:hypothetical protein [Candidatus Sungbacteria bacterium]
MLRSGLPTSVRKFVRREKARIRREFSYGPEAEEKIHELVAKIRERYTGGKGHRADAPEK